jgi:integrase
MEAAPMPTRTPSYRLHRPSGQAVVTLNGRDIYLGKHGTPESRAEYDRRLAEWLASGRAAAPGADATVSELMVGYVRHVDAYYTKAGRPTTEPGMARLALRVLKQLYGHTPARAFGPLALKAVRRAYVEAGLCRGEANRRTRHVVRFFRWCVENELVPPAVLQGLKAVPGLRKGRCDAREGTPVGPVPDAAVDAVRPFVPRQAWAMIELQRLTGMRPGEVAAMRRMDDDASGPVWEYTPGGHKTEHHGKRRTVYLGPRAQEVLRPWLRDDPAAFLFSPAEAHAERLAAMRARRRTRVQPSQRDRSSAAASRRPGASYSAKSYHTVVARACDKAFPHPTLSGVAEEDLAPEQAAELKAWRKAHRWHPNQLRHSAATRLRREFGLDVARVILGHSSPAVTEVYAEVDRTKAVDVMARVG